MSNPVNDGATVPRPRTPARYRCLCNGAGEGAGKPLSNLQNGQMVKIRQNASGVVTGLTDDTGIINRSCLPASRMAVLFVRGR
ncbi:hypothetical protein MJ581_24605 [Escherichia coli]|nr:hypothetical protein MJ581_24605 [Escherichia coli]